MKLKEFFKAIIDLPIKRLELMVEEKEKIKKDIDLRRKCIELSWSLPRINHEDVYQARAYLIQGNSTEALKALILYINKTSK